MLAGARLLTKQLSTRCFSHEAYHRGLGGVLHVRQRWNVSPGWALRLSTGTGRLAAL